MIIESLFPVIPTKSSSHWTESGLAELNVNQLIDANVGKDDTVVCSYGSVYHGDRSAWGFLSRIRGRLLLNKVEPVSPQPQA